MIPDKKELVYNDIDRFADIVAKGEYKGVKFVCLNRGACPAAYVMCTQEFLDKHADDEYNTIEGLHVHGGITYYGMANKLLGMEDFPYPCFGWDYGHAGDWAGYISDEENIAFGHRKYSTEMLIADCKSAIDQYLRILRKDANADVNNPILTKEYLKDIGFTPVINGIEDALQVSSGNDVPGKRWKIFIDLQNANKSYALNQSPRRKYEGEITTMDDLRSIIQLFDIPLKLS